MIHSWSTYPKAIANGDIRALARCISLVENAVPGYQSLLELIDPSPRVKIIGVTGPPGAGKSTLVDAMISSLVNQGKRVAVLCVDPSSPFNLGALLGDRVRMSDWYNHPGVYIRSLATRGSLGGLHPAIIEITELLKAAPFDHIIVETVGVGQSEVEITGLSDTTVVVLIPESGDEIQTMKAGLMEIADIFVVNKSDRPEADTFVGNLKMMMNSSGRIWKKSVPIIKTIAAQKAGVEDLLIEIGKHENLGHAPEKRSWLLTERAFRLLQDETMKGFDKNLIKNQIESELTNGSFNLFRFVKSIQATTREFTKE